jgi:translation initiation factor 1
MDRFLDTTFRTDVPTGITDRTSKIHIRMQQLGKKRLTTVEGLDNDLDLKRISRYMKKLFSCSVTVIKDDDEDGDGKGDIIQLQGDHREAVRTWLVTNEVLTEKEAKERVVIHGA